MIGAVAATAAGRAPATGRLSAAASLRDSVHSWVGSTPSLRPASCESEAASCASGTLASIRAARANAFAGPRPGTSGPGPSASTRSSA